MDDKTQATEQPTNPDVDVPPVGAQPTTQPAEQAPLVRHATPPQGDRGRIGLIAACASLAGVIVGFALSTAVYRAGAPCAEVVVPPEARYVTPLPQAPPPAPRHWRWHQHGDHVTPDHGCDGRRGRGHWSPPPPKTPTP